MSSSGVRKFPIVSIIELPEWYKHPWQSENTPENNGATFIWCFRCGEYKSEFMKNCTICNEECIQLTRSCWGRRSPYKE